MIFLQEVHKGITFFLHINNFYIENYQAEKIMFFS